jgi:hypothetical protein
VRREAASERLLRTCQKTTWEGEGHTVQGMSSNWLGLSSFGLGAAGMFATVYCTQAILPTLGREFGVGAARTGLTISVVVVAMAYQPHDHDGTFSPAAGPDRHEDQGYAE